MTRHEKIAARAYELFLQRGGAHGYHHADWTQAEAELREYSVVLKDVGKNKIGVLKELRVITGLELPAAEKLMQRTPAKVVEAAPRQDAEQICARLKAVGANAELR